METAAALTLHLLDALGLYLLAIGAGALLAPERWQRLGEEMEASTGLTLLMGITAFAIGVAMLGVHHGLHDPPAIVVTAVAAIAVVEGMLILAVPRVMIRIGAPLFARPRAPGRRSSSSSASSSSPSASPAAPPPPSSESPPHGRHSCPHRT
jgi:uncharacterized protein YjeT (DUF2065 family)